MGMLKQKSEEKRRFEKLRTKPKLPTHVMLKTQSKIARWVKNLRPKPCLLLQQAKRKRFNSAHPKLMVQEDISALIWILVNLICTEHCMLKTVVVANTIGMK